MEELTLQSIRDNEQQATNANTDQLFSGVDSLGFELPPYSKRSVQVFGKPEGPIRLFDTGNFYRGFFIKAKQFPIEIDSTDSKTNKLVVNFGLDIFGLTKANLEDFSRSYVLPTLQEKIRSFLGLR